MSVPKLRFLGFAGDWQEKRIRDFGHFYYGKSAPKFSLSDDAPTPCVRYGELYSTYSEVISEIKSFTNIDPKLLKFSKGGEVLVPRVGEDPLDFAQCSLLTLPNVAIGEMISVFNTKEDGLFVTYLFRTQKYQFARMVEGGSVSNLYFTYLEPLLVSIPTVPEQKKIAAFLGAVDAKIAALRAEVSGLETYKRGLMQALFSQRLRFTKPDGTAFPDWEKKRLGEVFEWVKTNSLSREFLTYSGGEVQNIHYGDIHTKFKANFAQDAEQVPFVADNMLAKSFSDEEFCRLGDVIIADASEDYTDIGKAIEIVQVRERSLVAGLHTYIGRPKGKMVVLGFAGYLFRTPAMRKQIMRIAQGISVLGISKPNLSKLELLLPHPDEQRKIADALSVMDTKIQAVTAQVTQMETFKKGLLQQMFV